MKDKIKSVLKYVILLSLTGFLLYISIQNIDTAPGESKLDFILNVWNTANVPFLFISAAAAIISHLIRAERWKLLLDPLNYQTRLSHSFLSVMVGYFINLAIPRGGEVSRCYNLYQLNKTPVNLSLGTVVAERVIDLIFLIVLLATSFLVELDNLLFFFQSDEIEALTKSSGGSNTPWFLLIGGILFLAALYFIYRMLFHFRKTMTLRYMAKGKTLFQGLKNGLSAVFKLKRRGLFIFYSLLIWVCYYLMMYFVMLAFPETASLGLLAALTIFVIGGIAMAIPLPGGAGSFHILVPLGLVMLYGLSQEKAVAFTFIFHGWQTLVIILVGAFSLFTSQFIKKENLDKSKNS